MDWLAGLVTSGRIADLILVVLALELVLLAAWRWRTGHGVAVGELLPVVLSGAFLVLALRGALTGGGPLAVAVPLAGALGAHLADLIRRWR